MMPELICPTGVVVATVLWLLLCRGIRLWSPPPVEPLHELTEDEVNVAWAAMVAALRAEEKSEKEGL